MPSATVSDLLCEMKQISRNALKIHFSLNLTKPIYDVWLHSVFYYRFNGLTYKKFPIDLWENGCGWLAGTTKSWILDWTVGKVLNYSNLNHPCPYEGNVYLKVDSVPVSNFVIDQFLPAGKYRIDYYCTNGNRSDVLFSSHMFMSVSDNRIEQF